MEKLMFASFLVLILSCQNIENKNETFRGFGNLKTGTTFSENPDFKLFRKLEADYFSAKEFHLSKEIGYVKDLYVRTKNGKIFLVQFDRVETTNIQPIQEIIKELKDVTTREDTIPANRLSYTRRYLTANNNLSFSTVTFTKNLKNNKPEIFFMYFDNELMDEVLKDKGMK
ncbi:hypothetical protein L1S35_05210 [Flavobacterium sp. AS60]|uniref:hypothetical protein n=1 Tax=Flavobacterium anseongense TaxID=2910677 RepID=UPI001F398C56|nr:hypothetical protein [Flavobacterium sp. AS60]MCF6129063.1 hypothetical protein [Flavobacterium sp. AS60]